MNKHLHNIFLVALILAFTTSLVASPHQIARADGSISLTALGSAYLQDFDSLVNTGTSSIVPVGWSFLESGTNANMLYTAGTGSSNTGDTYSFGAAGSTERAFGGLLSSALIPTIGASFVNNTGFTVNELIISYTGEQWRLGTTARVDRIDFQFSLDATSLTTGTWTDVNVLDFMSPYIGTVGLLDGNAAEYRTALSYTILGLSIPDSASFWIRWSDFNASGADDGLSVDEFSLTPTLDSAPLVSSTTPTSNASGVLMDTDITISFNEPVDVAGAWFEISCASSGEHTALATGGPVSFTLNPDVDFKSNESCSVTIFATQVGDQRFN